MARLCLSRLTGTRCNTHCNTHCNALHTSPRTTKTLLCLSRLTATTCTTHCNTHCNILQTATCLLCGWCFAMYCNAYCNTLQHTLPYTTATHCNTTATHCNTHCHTHCNKHIHASPCGSRFLLCIVTHTATHCNTLQHTATHCNTHHAHASPLRFVLCYVLQRILQHAIHLKDVSWVAVVAVCVVVYGYVQYMYIIIKNGH